MSFSIQTLRVAVPWPGLGLDDWIYDLNPPGCRCPNMRRGTQPACKKQTAFLLRLADFCGAPRRVLAKTGALRQTQLPVSSTGRGRCVYPCSASAVSAAGSASAAQPTAHSGAPCRLRRRPLTGALYRELLLVFAGCAAAAISCLTSLSNSVSST